MLSIEYLKTKPHKANAIDKRAIANLRPYLAAAICPPILLKSSTKAIILSLKSKAMKISRISIMKAKRFAK